METKEDIYHDITKRMEGALKAFKHDISGLRSGRASANLLDPIVVEAYGSRMPISQLASVAVPEPRSLSVQVWDKALVKAVEKAISASNLGLNPQADGQLIRINLPQLTEERRRELVKVAHEYGERGKVAIRNVRRDAIEQVKKLQKDKTFSEDEMHHIIDEIQKITDNEVAKINQAIKDKEGEIMN